MTNKGSSNEPTETDEIWPRAEGGPKEPWNQRRIPRSQNRKKGAEMPYLNDLSDSPNPLKLAASIDERSLSAFIHSRNQNRGFGGHHRYRLW